MCETEHEEEYVIELANEVRKQLGNEEDFPKEVKALLKPVVVSRVPQAHVSTRQRVFAS